MSQQQNIDLVRLGDSNLTLGDPNADIRGRKVIDRAGNDIGEVEDLMIGREDARVFFLLVGSGGFLGIGEKTFVVPVDAITGIDEQHVHVDRTREHVAGGPEYDPSIVREGSASGSSNSFWEDTYAHYDYGPFWAPGYTYPAYPYYETGGPGRPDAPGVPDDHGTSGRRTGV